MELLCQLDQELAENAEELGEPLHWSAAEVAVRESLARNMDRQVDLWRRWGGHLHNQAKKALTQMHIDGSPCDWCGRPMWLDKTKNWDYKPESKHRGNGSLQADHIIARSKLRDVGLPIPLPERLLHGACNRQRGDGGNDHLAWINRPELAVPA